MFLPLSKGSGFPQPEDFMNIYITGISGSGKTEFANRMGRISGIRVMHLDDFARVARGMGLDPWDYFYKLFESFDGVIIEGAQICGLDSDWFKDKCVIFMGSGFWQSMWRRVMRDVKIGNWKNIWKYDIRLFHIGRYKEARRFWNELYKMD